MSWPKTSMYARWQDWAAALIVELGKKPEQQVTQTRIYTVATLPPPIKDGQIVGVSDDGTGVQLAISRGTKWLRCTTGVEVA